MIDFFYGRMFRRTAHYSFFPLAAFASIYSVGTIFESDISPIKMGTREWPPQVKLVVKDVDKVVYGHRSISSENSRVMFESSAKLEFAIKACDLENRRAEQEFFVFDTPEVWMEWSEIDKKCRYLRSLR